MPLPDSCAIPCIDEPCTAWRPRQGNGVQATRDGARKGWGGLRAGLLVAVLLACAMPALATERWQVLVIGETSGEALPPEHPAWRRADEAIGEQLVQAGFSIYDKAALGLGEDCVDAKCRRRPVQEYVAWAREHAARMHGSRIDLIVIYEVAATQRRGAATRPWRVRVPGRMVDVATAEVVDQWSGGETEFSDIPADCTGACEAGWVAGRVAEVAREVGAALAEKLGAYERRFVFQASASGFTPSELDRLEAALRASRDYGRGGLRLLGGQSVEREWLHRRAARAYEFRTPLGSGALNALLERTLHEQGIPADVVLEGREFTLRRTGMPYAGRYVAAFLLPLLAGLMGWLAWDYRRHDKTLARLAHARAAGPGLDHLQRLSRRPLPLLPRWERYAADWRKVRADCDATLAQAETAIRAGQFDAAREALGRAQKLEPEHPLALKLTRALPDRERARRLLDAAAKCLDADPSSSAKALTQARELDTTLEGAIRPLLSQAQERLRRGLVRAVQERALQALDAGRPYAALSAAGSGLAAIVGLEGMDDERQQLQGWCDRACTALSPLTGPAMGVGLLAGVRLLVDDCIDIGRGEAASSAGVGLGFKRASRLGRLVRVVRDRRGLALEDQGSSNGALLDGRLLSGAPERLHGVHDLALGGQREPPSPGACRLRLCVMPEDGSSLMVAVDRSMTRILDVADLATAWPSLAGDLAQTWVLLADAVPFFLGEHLLPAQAGESAAFWLGYAQGYFLLPGNADGAPEVRVAGELLTTRVPLLAGTRVSVGGREFWLDAW